MDNYDSDTYEEKPAPGHRYDHLMPKRRSHTIRNRVLLGLCGIVLIGASITGFLVWYKNNKKTATMATIQQTTPQATASTQPQLGAEEASTPQVYKSTKMNIEITHRKDWQLNEDTASGTLSVTSPNIAYLKNGVSTQGVFTLKFRMGADTSAQDVIHKATAIQDSETIGYAAPTASQYYYTNLTIGGSGDAASFVMVSSATKYKAGDLLSKYFINNDTYIIVGGYGAAGQTQPSLMQFDAVPKAQFTQTPAYQQAVDIIKSLKIF